MAKSINNKILISGCSSGIGKYLSNKIKCTKYNRNKDFSLYNKTKWDLIIHAGFYAGNSNLQKTFDSIYHSYCLSRLKSKRYFFLSSAIVYENNKTNVESSKLNISHSFSNYCKAKIISESFFDLKKTIIIRLGSIVGKNMRKNTIYKIMFENKPKIKLSGESLNSFIAYSEVLEFINQSQKKNLHGIYNLLRTDYIKLSKISKLMKKNVKFGKIYFKCIKASNKKIDKFLYLSKYKSIDVLINFLKDKKK